MMKNIFTALFLPLFISLSFAQGAISLNVWPPKIDLNVSPGESRTGIININNRGNERVQVYCYITDVSMDKQGTLRFPEGGSLPNSCEEWMLINPENFFLSQGSSQQARYTLKVPEVASGTYLASIFFHTKPKPDTKGTGNALAVRVGTLFIINVTGTGFKEGTLTSLSLNNTGKANTAQVELGFINKGNILLRPQGTVEIKAENGWTVEKLNFNETEQAVLPNSERVFRVPLANIKPGNYNLTATVDYGGAEILSGETKVVLIAAEASVNSWPITQPKPPVKTSAKTVKPAEPVVKASPEEIKNLYNLATKQYTSGDYQSALASWQKLLKIDPGNSSAQKNMERTRAKLDALKKIKG
jgi:TolA-binding protein